jgi:hypothetical protein
MGAGAPARLTRLTAAEGRRFGLTVGAAFLALAALLLWRQARLAAAVLGALGAALVAGALVVPARLGPVERAWMGLARAISTVTTPVLMGVLYFLLLTPVGLGRRWLRRSPLARSRGATSLWAPHESGGRSDLRRQF